LITILLLDFEKKFAYSYFKFVPNNFKSLEEFLFKKGDSTNEDGRIFANHLVLSYYTVPKLYEKGFLYRKNHGHKIYTGKSKTVDLVLVDKTTSCYLKLKEETRLKKRLFIR
jgi:hypothetical protein